MCENYNKLGVSFLSVMFKKIDNIAEKYNQ